MLEHLASISHHKQHTHRQHRSDHVKYATCIHIAHHKWIAIPQTAKVEQNICFDWRHCNLLQHIEWSHIHCNTENHSWLGLLVNPPLSRPEVPWTQRVVTSMKQMWWRTVHCIRCNTGIYSILNCACTKDPRYASFYPYTHILNITNVHTLSSYYLL